MSDAYVFDIEAEDGWIGVSGGGLPFRVRVKVRFERGALVVVGMHIEGSQPIGSTDLRAIRMPRLVEHLGAFLAWQTSWLQAEAEVARDEASDAIQASPRDAAASDTTFVEHTIQAKVEEARSTLEEWHARVSLLQQEAEEWKPRGRGARPPSDTELKSFARVYLEQVMRGKRGAKTRTAKQLSMDRTTVYRWIAECLKPDRGYIPDDRSD
jgi:hypothetical protein